MADPDIVSITRLKTEAADLVRSIVQERRTVTVTQNGEARVVVMGAEAYADLQSTLAMLKLLALSEQDLEDGASHSTEEVFERARARIRTISDE